MTHSPDSTGRRLAHLLDLARHALADAHREASAGPLQPQHRQLILDALHRPDGGDDGLLHLLGDLITDTSRDLPEGDAAEQLDEAAGYASDYPAQRIDRARAALAAPTGP
ncbi:hypothetical protein ACFWUZ_31975 [Streptomyces sp. NPDC058646]|uniref:hypothetical protein n=1 Tax=Streptomyces sp. NPDC058646 TaxID=3346574 RepID=UPI0036492250